MRCKRSALALMNNTAIVSLYISRPLLFFSLHPPLLSLSPLWLFLSRTDARAHGAQQGGREGVREGGREGGEQVRECLEKFIPRTRGTTSRATRICHRLLA